MKKQSILIAPNAFKGTYSSSQAAAAIAAGLRQAGCKASLDLLPLADGGPGTLACMPGRLRTALVHDALGRKRRARWLLLKPGQGLIESAEAIGLTLIPAARRDALAASSRGLGELMLAAKKAGCRELLIGLGGSATSDGGWGMAQALGWSLADGAPAGAPLPPKLNPLSGVRIKVLCDVDSPLYGKSGAAYVFGPQKGASGPQVRLLDARLRRLAAAFPKKLALLPGAGAAGGLGFGLMAFCGAKLVPGAATLLKLSGFEARLRRSAWVLSGEGRFDSQSLRGKLPYAIAQQARRLKKPCTLLVGQCQGRFAGLEIMPLQQPGRKKLNLRELGAEFWRSHKNLLDRHFS